MSDVFSKYEELNDDCVELVTEINFFSNISWSSVNYGLFYDKIRYFFPKIKERLDFNYSYLVPKEFDNSNFDERIGKMFRLFFYSDDGSSAVQLLENTLIVNQLKKKDMFYHHSSSVTLCSKIYEEVFKPMEISRRNERRIYSFNRDLSSFKVSEFFSKFLDAQMSLRSNDFEQMSFSILKNISEKTTFNVFSRFVIDKQKNEVSIYMDLSLVKSFQ